MSSYKRFIAKVPSSRAQAIQWLVLEQDDEHTGGWYLYGHEDLDKGSEFDSWHLTRLDAENEAALQWGVTEQDWKSSPN